MREEEMNQIIEGKDIEIQELQGKCKEMQEDHLRE